MNVFILLAFILAVIAFIAAIVIGNRRGDLPTTFVAAGLLMLTVGPLVAALNGVGG